MTSYMYKSLFAAAGGVLALFTSILPLLWVCFLFILIDGLSAYELNKRVIKRAKNKKLDIPKNAGKFRSSRAYKMIRSMRDIAILISLGYLLDNEVFNFFENLNLANYVTGVFCVIQAWSILENASSCNGSAWAKVLQKYLVDKSERHLSLDLNVNDCNCEDLDKKTNGELKRNQKEKAQTR